MSLPGVGMSILEISHRSKPFDEIIEGCEADLRDARPAFPTNYNVLFLQGGASLQFSMVPMNLLPAGGSADYIVTGVVVQKAVKEAKRVGGVKIAASTEAENFTRVPRQDELKLDPECRLRALHDEQHDLRHRVPLRARRRQRAARRRHVVGHVQPPDRRRRSSALIYAGAQKNLAPAGVTLVIIREDLLARTPASLPTMLQYGVHAENKSMYNTPPVFAIYVMRLVLKWLLKEGGLDGDRTARNARKADKLYAEIDRTGFYRGHAQKDSRSRMNVTFRLPSEELEKKFAKEATAAGLDGLKGHRSVGGMRASIYNAFPEAASTRSSSSCRSSSAGTAESQLACKPLCR